MTWLKTDDRFPEHRKIRRLGDAAYRLHHQALSFAAKDETDGVIHVVDVEEMQHGRRLSKHIPALVDAGLWKPIEGGWQLHDFLDYNPSHAHLEAERAASRERQARARAKRRGVTSDDAESNAVTNGVSHAPVTRESQAPVPSRTVPNRKKRAQPVAGAVLDLDLAAPEAAPDDGGSIEQRVTAWAYERTGKAFNFISTRQLAKWAIHEKGADPGIVAKALVALYEDGKPFMKTTLGQHLDGFSAATKPDTRPGASSWNRKLVPCTTCGGKHPEGAICE